jgi:hypothetical protein
MTRNTSSAPEQERLILVPIPLPPSFPDLDRAIQRSFGDLERPANLHNGMSSIVEILGNTQMSAGEDFGPAACPSSGAGCGQTGGCPFPNEVSFKLRQRPKDMKNQLAATGCGINVLRQAFKPNPTFLKSGQGSNEMGQERPKEKGGHSPTRGENYPATNFDQQVRSAQQIEDLGFASKPLITPGR